MKNNLCNPWHGMSESTQRRIDSKIKHDLFWITDLEGRYGFYIKSDRPFHKTDEHVNLRGIIHKKRNSSGGCGELFLILNEKEDWQIFHTLCMDLVSVAERHEDCDKMIFTVENRLLRWKQLLKSQKLPKMTLERQMGLFTELLCLRDIMTPKCGLRSAVHAWGGPEFDKQDFSTDDTAIEVKSYRSSKGKTVSISSAGQLYCQKEKFYLIAYGLTSTDNGQSIDDVATDLIDKLQDVSCETIPSFENKLIEYGYVPELFKDPLYKFVVDDVQAYVISEAFPVICPDTVDPAIISVKYDIDLSKCTAYETDLNL